MGSPDETVPEAPASELAPIPEGQQVTIDILANAQRDLDRSASLVIDEEVNRPSEATPVQTPDTSAIEASGGVVNRAFEQDLETADKGSIVYSEGTAQDVQAGVARDLTIDVTGPAYVASKGPSGEDGVTVGSAVPESPTQVATAQTDAAVRAALNNLPLPYEVLLADTNITGDLVDLDGTGVDQQAIQSSNAEDGGHSNQSQVGDDAVLQAENSSQVRSQGKTRSDGGASKSSEKKDPTQAAQSAASGADSADAAAAAGPGVVVPEGGVTGGVTFTADEVAGRAGTPLSLKESREARRRLHEKAQEADARDEPEIGDILRSAADKVEEYSSVVVALHAAAEQSPVLGEHVPRVVAPGAAAPQEASEGLEKPAEVEDVGAKGQQTPHAHMQEIFSAGAFASQGTEEGMILEGLDAKHAPQLPEGTDEALAAAVDDLASATQSRTPQTSAAGSRIATPLDGEQALEGASRPVTAGSGIARPLDAIDEELDKTQPEPSPEPGMGASQDLRGRTAGPSGVSAGKPSEAAEAPGDEDPEAREARVKAEAERVAAEEEARRVAEEEAKRKAEEEAKRAAVLAAKQAVADQLLAAAAAQEKENSLYGPARLKAYATAVLADKTLIAALLEQDPKGGNETDVAVLRVCAEVAEAADPEHLMAIHESAHVLRKALELVEAGEELPHAIQSVVLTEEFEKRVKGGEESLTVFKDYGSRKPGGKLLGVALTLLIRANQWPVNDPKLGAETKAVLEDAAEKGKLGKAMTQGIDTTAAKKEYGSNIQVFHEQVSLGLGGAAVTKEQRAGNEVIRRLGTYMEEEKLEEATTDVRRKTMKISAQFPQANAGPASRVQTPEEERQALKNDLGYLATAVGTEASMLQAMSKIEKPQTMVSWHRALGVVKACLDAVKQVPTKEADANEIELLLTLVEDARDEVDMQSMTSQVRVVTEIRKQLAAKKDLRTILRTLGKHAADLPRKVLAQVLYEMAEGREEKIAKALNDAANLAENSKKSVNHILRVAAAAIDPEVARDLRRLSAEQYRKPLVEMLVEAGLQKPDVIVTDDTTDAMDIAPFVKRSMDGIFEDVFDSMDAEDAEGQAPEFGEEQGMFVGAMKQLVHVKQKQLAHEVQANMEVERLKTEMERREAASANYMVKLKQAQQKQVEELLAHIEREKKQYTGLLDTMNRSAEEREGTLQDELALTRRRAEQRARLLEERMQRKDSTAAATSAQQKSMYDQMAKSYEAELARRRKEISFGEGKYTADTSKLKAEIKRLREKVTQQRSQISGISNDLVIYRKALLSFEASREKDHQNFREYRQSLLLQKPILDADEFGQGEDTEPEIEPAEPEEGTTQVVDTTLAVESGEKSPAYLDILATLMSTQAALDRTQKQCDKQAKLLRELRHVPGTEEEIILQDKVKTLEAQLEAAQAAALNASPVSVPFKGHTYELSRFAPRTMRGQDEPSRQSSVPTLPQV
jgi:hypothetical protein